MFMENLKLILYRFQYDLSPYIRLVSEKMAPTHLLSEFYKRENLQNANLIGPVQSCYIKKDFKCFNKKKTRGKPSSVFLIFL